MTPRAGLTIHIALSAITLFSAFILCAQAAPVPTHANAISNTNVPSIQVPPATAPVPNTHFVGLQLHSHLGSVPARGTIVHDVAGSEGPQLVKRKGGGGHAAPAHPAPAHPAPAHPAPAHAHPAPAHPAPAHAHPAPAHPAPAHAHPAPAQHAAAPPAHHHESVAAKIRGAFHKAEEGIKHAAQAVGHFVKTQGAKIAKVALKVASTAQKIASKVVGNIPIPGFKAIGRVMGAESMGLNKASNAIHANIGGKLGQAMHRMDKAQKVVGYIPRSVIPEEFEVEEREFEGFEERDAEEFEEREFEEVEEREFEDLEQREFGDDDSEEFTARESFEFAERSLDDEDAYMF